MSNRVERANQIVCTLPCTLHCVHFHGECERNALPMTTQQEASCGVGRRKSIRKRRSKHIPIIVVHRCPVSSFGSLLVDCCIMIVTRTAGKESSKTVCCVRVTTISNCQSLCKASGASIEGAITCGDAHGGATTSTTPMAMGKERTHVCRAFLHLCFICLLFGTIF